MEKAKEAVAKFTGRQGHTTEVDEHVRAPVTSETVKPTRHEEHTQAVDREVHQDHYHTTVQPVQDREVLPEKHVHQAIPVEHKEFRHNDESATRQHLEHEQAQFQDTSRTHETKHTQGRAAGVAGEHTHHHVHETVQPVIHKEVIQPEVVHTTVPIHETHHADSQFHGQSVLPTKTLDEVKGSLSQGARHHEEYEGVPKPYNTAMQTQQTDADRFPGKEGVDPPGSHHAGGTGLGSHDKFVDPQGHQSTSSTGNTSASQGQGYDQGHQTSSSGYATQGQSHGLTSSHQQTGHDSTGGSTTNKKPSLMDKMNPKIDSDGDGKAGFMK